MKAATTWEHLVANYEVFANTNDIISVEAMDDDIRRFAESNGRRFIDVLRELEDTVWPELPY